jgi:alginate O-acetyltransferase complex protein AlgI
MLFSSSIFIFLFLPVLLALYFGLRPGLRNIVLLAGSLCFYIWGEKLMVGLLFTSILSNYVFGLWIDRSHRRGAGKAAVSVAVAFNLTLLVLFKYGDWLWSIVSWVAISFGWRAIAFPDLGTLVALDEPWRSTFLTADGHIRLPLGISFFTFQALSYVLDVYRREAEVQRTLTNFALYKALFPQLIAGPIVRYKDVATQLVHRTVTRADFALGVRRFIIGLGKKMLIANVVAKAADGIFGSAGAGLAGVPVAELTPSLAWVGIVCYTLQIYFDFSGYSDMAIGLGHMFGFTFLENFNYPYISRSITEFWRRWHISLSTWFRDYLYIPLGGNRVRPVRTYLNLLTVFFLCGLWHGASFNFIVWGLYHGLFLVIERIGFGRWLDARGAIVRHAYVLLVVMVGWVFFRSPDLSSSLVYLRALFGLQAGTALVYHPDLYVDSVVITAIIAGCIGSMPWLQRVKAWHAELGRNGAGGLQLGLEVAALCSLMLVFFCSALELSAGTYNPFIYFRF